MRIGYGKERIVVFLLLGVLVAGSIMLVHELLEYYHVPNHNLILFSFIPLVGFGMALLARREVMIFRRGEELESARNRIQELMQTAVRKGRTPSFEDDWLPTCWSQLECDQKDCPVYGREHTRCWLVAGTFCRGEVQGQFARKLKDCRLCQVYKQATMDPVSEITETFYAMNYLLGEREEQLAEALEKARERGEKLTGLVELSEAALSSVHLSDLLGNLIESAAALVGADFGIVSLTDSEEASLVVRDTYGLDADAAAGLSVKVGEGIIGQAYAGGYIAVSEDVETDTRLAESDLAKIGARTLISLPLVGRERPLGMLTLGTITSHHYNEEEKDSLCVAADHIAVTVENTMLAGSVGSDREQVELLMAANRDMGAGGGIENVYKLFIANARRMVDFDRASLMFLNKDASEVEIAAADTASPRTWLGTGIRLPLEALPLQHVFRNGRPLIREQVSDNEYPADKLLAEEGIASEVLLPLAAEGQVIGSFNLGSFQPGAFNMEDVEMLMPMTRQLGLIIENAQLLQDVKRFDLVDRLTRLYNHRYFVDALIRETARARRDGFPVAVMIVHIENFKEFNREHSRAAGDRLLQGVAEVLRASVREIDIAARYSGDKFAVLLPEVSAGKGGADGELMRVADRIREDVNKKVFVGDTGGLALCIGISEYPAHASDPLSLLERADWAVRKAAESGDGCVVVAEEPVEPGEASGGAGR